jgi:tRNA A58 N-methylase Trm61
MAKLGFYEIVTIECLNREYEVRKHHYRAIPDYETIPRDQPLMSHTERAKSKGYKGPGASSDNKRQAKVAEKEMMVSQPLVEMRGHTGYLTFAIKF